MENLSVCVVYFIILSLTGGLFINYVTQLKKGGDGVVPGVTWGINVRV